MSFVSFAFLGFVLLCLLAYYLIPKRFRYIVLLLFSYAFYVITCKKYILYILVTTVTTWAGGLYIGSILRTQKAYLKENKETLSREEKKAYKAQMKKRQKTVLVLDLLFNFGILAVIKYADFAIANFNWLKLTATGSTNFLSPLNLVLPLGISFYTFQAMGYLIDLYFGKYEEERNPLKVALFVSFFPQIIQGPISRFDELSTSLFEGHAFDETNLIYGGYQILWGLFKKLMIADKVAPFVTGAVAAYRETGGTYLLLAIFLYSMEIYGDFSGGIDITIGVARLFGVQVTANFERPFFSKSVAEYWRRWHITLGTWFKDYIFYPLSIAKWTINLGKWIRTRINENLGKKVPIYLSMFIVWFTTGLWHGSQWRYIIWGLLNCVILVFSTEMEPVYEKINNALHLREGSFVKKSWQVIRTFWIMSFLRVFDVSNEGVSQAVIIIKKALTDWCILKLDVIESLGIQWSELKVALLAIAALFVFDLIQRRGSVRDRLMKLPTFVRWGITLALLAVVIIYGSYGIGYDSRAFIYLQF